DLGRHGDAPLVAPVELALAQQGDGVAQAELTPDSLVEETIELIADGGQMQPGQHVADRFGVAAHHHLPPAACSYSDKGRSSAGSAATAGLSPVGGSPVTNGGRLMMPARWPLAIIR